MHPVGPQSPRVYWVRRIVVVVVLLVVLLALWWVFFGRSTGGSAPGSATGSGLTPTPTSTPTSPTASRSTASPTASSSSTATPDCTNKQIDVTVTTDASSYPAGVDPVFTLSVTNVSSSPCLRDVGSAAEELTVTTGQTRVWSSDDCNPAGSADVQKLVPGKAVSVQVQWGRDFSQPGCPTGQPAASAGTYQVTGRVGDKSSTPTAFSLT